MRMIASQFDPPAYVYQELMPSQSDGFKESYKRELDTFTRIEFFKNKALRNGMLLKLKSEAHLEDHQKLFTQPILSKKENLPRIKMSDVTTQVAMMKRNEDHGCRVQTAAD